MIMPAQNIRTSKNLGDLLRGFAQAPEIEISGIASDSRQLGEGYLFLACAGERSHGVDYIDNALAAGVGAIAFDADTASAPGSDIGVPMIAVPGLASLLGEIANRFYDSPSEDIGVVGITGTNGKTTVAWFAAQCLNMLDKRCAYVGTLGAGFDELDIGEAMTTPGAVELHGRLAEFRNAGAKAAAIEVSSHALAQNRVDGVSFDTVMFTNLSRDHLDYHGDMQSYAEEKARLFTEHKAKHRIINLDSEFGMELAYRCGQQIVTVSTHFDRVANGRPFVFARSVVAKNDGSLVRISSSWGDGEFLLPIPGDFNVANAVIVLALLLNQGVDIGQACDVLSAVTAPPGRMQRVAAADVLPAVYVDYAHSPVAIEVALRALRAHCKGRLWCIFGCGGDRDAGKRPMMAKAAERLADRVVVTNDNPRTESPTAIIDDIVKGFANADSATVIEDRAAAIAWAIAEAGSDDVVLIAGKGHEEYQLIGTQRLEFSDYGAAKANLEAREEGGA
jgi:UDP-N-acetylmuramoyl-L-alanyl-D-glutamate--2,6-diaminopimelate ligase